MTSQVAITLLKSLEQSLDSYCELNDEGKTAFRMAISALELFGNSEQLPSARPERKAGKWIRHFDGNEWYWYCSSCKEQWYENDLWMGGNSFPNFCPNCGCRIE